MEKYNKQKKVVKVNIKQIIVILVVLLIIIGFCYIKIFHKKINNYKFANQTEKFEINNEDPIFKVNKIILYSSAGAVDNSTNEVLQDLDISQFTDISIELENNKENDELTDKNTVSKLYIDNIQYESEDDNDEKILNYKNPYLFGKFKILNLPNNNRIDFKIIGTNQENEDANYDEPVFYTDCSNPISLGYINKNIVKGYCVSERDNSVTFDGKILKSISNKTIDQINCKISFNIHIVNNCNEEFVCPITIEKNLGDNPEEIYNGYIISVDEENNIKNFIQTK